MDDYQSERPAKPRRPTRRSMAELAASLESGAVVEKLPSQQAIINGQTNVAQGAPAACPRATTTMVPGWRTKEHYNNWTKSPWLPPSQLAITAPRCWRTLRSTSRPRPIVPMDLPARSCPPALPAWLLANRENAKPTTTRSNGSPRRSLPRRGLSRQGLSRQGGRADQCQRKRHPGLCAAARRCKSPAEFIDLSTTMRTGTSN